MDKTTELILRKRMHELYLSRKCDDITQLSHELLGLHCWFHRNAAFSALIRGADLYGWKTALTKTWVHHALHGVVYEDLPDLLALHPHSNSLSDFEREVICYMEDGVCSRAEFRQIFRNQYDEQFIDRAFSPWGGVFVGLAGKGLVAFRDMTSRDFDLISAEPTRTFDEVLPELLCRFFTVYGPATLADAAWFFGLWKDDKKKLFALSLDEFSRLEHNGNVYFFVENSADMGDIPELTLLSGFDPLIVSYAERSAVLPPEYKKAVIMSSGICLPTIAVNGQVAGVWNIKKSEPVVEFFTAQPKRAKNAAFNLAESICWQTRQQL